MCLQLIELAANRGGTLLIAANVANDLSIMHVSKTQLVVAAGTPNLARHEALLGKPQEFGIIDFKARETWEVIPMRAS